MSGPGTPSQTVGPFFSIGFAWLERTKLAEAAAAGTRVVIRGCVLDGDGKPVPDAVLEIWQADAEGRYAHPEDERHSGSGDGSGFWGFGRVPVNDQGEFQFTTIRPGSVKGADGSAQSPHLAISIFMRGLLRRLVTRIYFPGEVLNEKDAVLALVPADRRATLIARAGDDGKSLVWDVHLQGENETVFFDC
jgi:protocatechuate 3,4-dioxygenase, alpha subunit